MIRHTHPSHLQQWLRRHDDDDHNGGAVLGLVLAALLALVALGSAGALLAAA